MSDALNKKISKEFGYTDNIYEAGYIDKDGKMIDFSESNQGGGGSRSLDHRAIERVFTDRNIKPSDTNARTNTMKSFMQKNNAARVSVYQDDDFINVETNKTPLTESQINTLEKQTKSLSRIGQPKKIAFETILASGESKFVKPRSIEDLRYQNEKIASDNIKYKIKNDSRLKNLTDIMKKQISLRKNAESELKVLNEKFKKAKTGLDVKKVQLKMKVKASRLSEIIAKQFSISAKVRDIKLSIKKGGSVGAARASELARIKIAASRLPSGKKALIAGTLILAGAAAYKLYKSGQKGKWITIKGGRRIFLKG